MEASLFPFLTVGKLDTKSQVSADTITQDHFVIMYGSCYMMNFSLNCILNTLIYNANETRQGGVICGAALSNTTEIN